MVRMMRSKLVVLTSSPPARGDGPVWSTETETETEFSPRTGGWSVGQRQIPVDDAVLPPHGGMVRVQL